MSLAAPTHSLPVYEQTVEIDLSEVEVPVVKASKEDSFQLSLEAEFRTFVAIDDHVRRGEIESAEIMIDLEFEIWPTLALLKRFVPSVDWNAYVFKSQMYAPSLRVSVPITAVLGEQLTSGYGPMGDVDPSKYTCAKDLTSNPYSSPLDWNKIYTLAVAHALETFNALFEVFDSPESVRWVASSDRFPSTVMDRDSKTLRVLRSELDAFPNQSLVNLRQIADNRVGMGWSVEILD